MTSDKMYRFINYFILILTPIVIIITVMIGSDLMIQFLGRGDYHLYYEVDWTALLQGQNPYNYLIEGVPGMCFYPLGFLAFGGLYYLHPLLPKALFCLVWMLTAYVFNRICKQHQVSDGKALVLSVAFFVINPFYLLIVLVSGYFDVIIGLTVLLAVYSLENSAQIKSGIYASLALLFKFVGLVLFFPLIFTKKKIQWKLGLIGILICGGAYLLGFFLWGMAVFNPFLVNIFRPPEGSSILVFIEDVLGIDIAPLIPYAVILGVIIIAFFLYFKNNDITKYSLILVILFILILPVFWFHYVLWFFPLLIYWGITHTSKRRWILVSALIVFVLSFLLYWVFSLPSIHSAVTFLGGLIFILYIYLNPKKEELIQSSENK